MPLVPPGVLSPVHPRACGDNRNAVSKPPTLYGSPPRVRGQFVCAAIGLAALRFTPARAGTIVIGKWVKAA